jgi:hypothetical protein
VKTADITCFGLSQGQGDRDEVEERIVFIDTAGGDCKKRKDPPCPPPPTDLFKLALGRREVSLGESLCHYREKVDTLQIH